MELRQDFKELLQLLNAHGAEYLVVGGFALAFHGHPRFTKDLDVYVKPDPQNAQRILAAMADFGFASLDLRAEDFDREGQILQLGVEPGRIDIVTSISGVSWDEAWKNHLTGEYGGVQATFLGRDAFVKNKIASGRPQDLVDVHAIGGELPGDLRTLLEPRNNQAAKPTREGPR
jgi:hypothetical protein